MDSAPGLHNLCCFSHSVVEKPRNQTYQHMGRVLASTYIYIYICIGGLGELARLARPPGTGKSILICLCVWARRSCVGACGPLSLSLGLPGARIDVRVRSSFRSSFVHRRMGFNSFWHFLCRFCLFVLLCAWVLTSE